MTGNAGAGRRCGHPSKKDCVDTRATLQDKYVPNAARPQCSPCVCLAQFLQVRENFPLAESQFNHGWGVGVGGTPARVGVGNGNGVRNVYVGITTGVMGSGVPDK